jgi:hypothetical protein
MYNVIVCLYDGSLFLPPFGVMWRNTLRLLFSALLPPRYVSIFSTSNVISKCPSSSLEQATLALRPHHNERGLATMPAPISYDLIHAPQRQSVNSKISSAHNGTVLAGLCEVPNGISNVILRAGYTNWIIHSLTSVLPKCLTLFSTWIDGVPSAINVCRLYV